jgi:hypothetical protein
MHGIEAYPSGFPKEVYFQLVVYPGIDRTTWQAQINE